jgi:hypothetical protein
MSLKERYKPVVIYHYGFLRIVDKNLGRISKMEGKQPVPKFNNFLAIIPRISLDIRCKYA